MYNLNVEFKTKYDIQSKTISIGFRTAELIQKPIDENDPKMGILTVVSHKYKYLYTNTKTVIKIFLGLSFYFKINGVAIFAKGTNYIPANIFPEKINKDNAINYLLTSAKKVHMNTIRVWGGGVYESDEFYKVFIV